MPSIPQQAHRHHFVKAEVRVHQYIDGSLAVFHGPRCFARYDIDGKPARQAAAYPLRPTCPKRSTMLGAVKDAARRFAVARGHP